MPYTRLVILINITNPTLNLLLKDYIMGTIK